MRICNPLPPKARAAPLTCWSDTLHQNNQEFLTFWSLNSFSKVAQLLCICVSPKTITFTKVRHSYIKKLSSPLIILEARVVVEWGRWRQRRRWRWWYETNTREPPGCCRGRPNQSHSWIWRSFACCPGDSVSYTEHTHMKVRMDRWGDI